MGFTIKYKTFQFNPPNWTEEKFYEIKTFVQLNPDTNPFNQKSFFKYWIDAIPTAILIIVSSITFIISIPSMFLGKYLGLNLSDMYLGFGGLGGLTFFMALLSGAVHSSVSFAFYYWIKQRYFKKVIKLMRIDIDFENFISRLGIQHQSNTPQYFREKQLENPLNPNSTQAPQIGAIYGALRVIAKLFDKEDAKYWKCQCKNGHILTVEERSLKKGLTTKCLLCERI